MKCALVLNRAGLGGVCGHTDELTDVDIVRQIYLILHRKKPAILLYRTVTGGKVQGRFPVKSGCCLLCVIGLTDSNPLIVFTLLGEKLGN